MSIRLSIVAIALLAVAGCAPTYYGPPGVQPGTVVNQGGYGSNGGYAYGGGFGSGYDDDDGPIFRPSRHVTCDRTRDICYDRFGLDYDATARYFGERDANHAVKKYGEQVFLFSPKRGVTCDRRSRSCSDAGGLDVDLTEDYFGNRAEHRVDDWLESATFKPEPHVTCVTATKVCSDKKGPSITLTQVYFGRAAAQDLAEQLGPGAPGYRRAPEPAPNAAQQAPRAPQAEGAEQGMPPVATAEPLPAPEEAAPLPVISDTPISVDADAVQEPVQAEQPLPAQEPAIVEPAPEPVMVEPAPMPAPDLVPTAGAAPAHDAPTPSEGACSDPQGCGAQ